MADARHENTRAPVPRATAAQDRQFWIGVVDRLARPVLTAFSRGQFKKTFPVQSGGKDDRSKFAHLEALGRLLTGIAPWLETGTSAQDSSDEAKCRTEFAALARHAIAAGTDPQSPDYLNFETFGQPLVDAAFLAHALLRAPVELWHKLDAPVRTRVIDALKLTRKTTPPMCNWLLFSAIIEAFLFSVGHEWQPETVDLALQKHEEWYKGDGAYGDGPHFHWDYYNSFVIQPMLIDVLAILGDQRPDWQQMKSPVLHRAQRFAAVQERLISPEGTFPPLGRSLVYRFGAFQLLGQIALRHELPPDISPSQVRCALTAVIRRTIAAEGTFDAEGFLRIGFCGHQLGVAEPYISTGSLYLCAAGLLPLGLPASDPFWSDPYAEWTSRRIWSGQDMPADHAI